MGMSLIKEKSFILKFKGLQLFLRATLKQQDEIDGSRFARIYKDI